MKKFFSVETTENLIDAELGLLPTQTDTAIDVVLLAQLDQIASPEIDPGALNVVLDENAVLDDGYIIIDGVAIPTDIAEGEVEEIEPEAAPVALSGGGSAQPFELGDIGPNIDITDLLPPTALLFTIPEEEELDPFADPNDVPDVEVIPDTPIDPNVSGPTIQPIDAVADETALPGGSDAGSGADITTGDLVVDTGNDELASLVINDVDVTNGGTVTGTYGTLTITVNPDGTFEYTYVLTDNTIDHPDAGSVGTTEGISDDFIVVVTDDDGDTATDTLVVGIVDDGPVAVVDSVTQDEEDAPVSLDIFDNDTEGADGVNPESGLDIVPGSLSGDGTLVDNGDGTVTYTPVPGEEGDITFEYIITDGDGDTSTAVGTITLVDDSEPVLGLVPATSTVDESALDADGSNPTSDAETTSGEFTIDTGNDTIESLVIDGVDVTNGGVVTGEFGTLTVTETNGTYTYDYVLTGATDEHANGPVAEDFDVVVTDSDGDSASDTLVIDIVDDVPTAIDDSADQVGENNPITVDVFANDVEGADGVDPDTGIAVVPNTLSGNGTLVDNGDGTFTYTPEPGEEGTVTFDYEITDSDGDTSVATVTITLEDDSMPTLSVDAGSVEESALDSGSDAASTAETTAGNIAISTGDDTIDSLVIDGVDVTNGGVVTGEFGTLTVTETNGTYTYDYVLTGATDEHANGPVSEDFEVVVTDSDGDSVSDTLVIDIVDDVPTAVDDATTQTTEDTPVTIDVFANDVEGADGVDADSGVALVAGTLSGTGTLVDNGDGTFTYTNGPGEEGVVTFDYIITDSDGDTSVATATITLQPDSTPDIDPDPDMPSIHGGDASVDEAALSDGSNPASDGEATAGDFVLTTGNDTVGTLVIDGVDVTNGGTVTGDYGTLVVTETNGDYTWVYTLTDNTTDHTDGTSTGTPEGVQDIFDITVTDSDGDTADTSLTIDILDDGPTAVDDATTQATEDTPVTIDVFANDVEGADGVDADAGVELVAGTLSGTGTLVDNGDGTFTYTNGPGEEGVVTFDYIITDSDGDTSVATATITLQPDSTPDIDPDPDMPSIHGGDASVDEAALSDGSNPASDGEATAGDFVLTTGNDTVGTLVIDGVDVTNGGTVTGDYGTLVVTETNGDYTWVYTLTDNTTDHTDGTSTGTPEGVQDIFDITVTDSDGDTADTSLTIDVLDDGPTAVDDVNTATEGGADVTGNVVAENDTVGADDDTFTATLDSPAVGSFGTLTLNDDGSYSYTPNASVVAGSTDSFDYTLTDADGDTSTATLIITFEGDNNAPTAGTTTALADEDDLATGNNDTASGDDDAANLTGTLTHDYGVDGAGSITLLDGAQTVNGVDYTYTVSIDGSGDQVITANDGTQDVFTLTLTDAVTGTYEVELLASIEHLGSDPAFEDNLLFNLGYQVEDSDGSIVDGTFALTIDDDIPVEVEGFQPIVAVDEDELPGGITDGDTEGLTANGDVSALVEFGADQPGEFGLSSDTSGLASLTSGGVAITYAVVGNTLTASAGTEDVFTLVMNTDGTYVFTLSGTIDHAVADGDDNEFMTLDFGSIITASDADGDIIGLSQPVTVRIEDDVPTADADANVVAEGATLTVGVLDGVLVNDLEGADTATIAGVRAAGMDTTTDVTTGVGLEIDGLYGTLTLNSDGSYTYESAPNTIAMDSDDVFVYTLIDGDGDTVTTTLTINVLNGGLAAPTDTIQVDEAAIDTSIEGNDIAVGSVTGSLGTTSNDETATDALAASGGTGPYTYTIVGSSNGTYGTIELNADGTYTYTLTSPVDTNPDSNGPNVELAADSFTYQVEDANGNTETGTINVNIVDDAPIATLELAADASLIIDESIGENAGETEGGAAGLGQATILAADLFTDSSVFGADGAATTDSTVYSLNVTSGADTGLIDVATGQAIVLVDNAGVIEGQNTNGDVVFTIEVAANGDTTVTQLRAIEHDDATDPDEAGSPEILGAGFVELEVQVTDGDGDIDTASIDLGGVIAFEDDGPSIDASVTDGDTVTLTTQDADTIGAAFDVDTSTANFGSAFTIDSSSYGSDGAGTTVWAYSLSVDNAVSGMSSDGDAINLFLIGGEVIGSTAADAGSVTAGNTIFSIATNATTGEVTLTQFAEIDHDLPGVSSNYDSQLEVLADGLVSLNGTATITDRDGDTASETLSLDLGGNIQFADDGPAVTATPTMATLEVDETDLATDATADLSGAFSVDFEADGAGTTTYALDISANGVNSGMDDVASGEDILLRVNGDGDVEGYTATGNEIVFTVSVDANGVVELDQLRAIEHDPNTGPDQATGLSAADLITLSATATDGDGDTATGTIDLAGALTFRDDAPTIESTPTTASLVVDETDFATDATADLSGAFTSSFGADGAGDITYGLSISALDADTGLVDVETGEAILLRINGAGEVEGYSATGGVVFTVSVNASGVVELDQERAIEHSPDTGPDQATGLVGSDLITLTARITDRDGDTDTATVDLSGALSFEDDAPSASSNSNPVDTLVLDESPIADDGIASATANFADNFTAVDYGADGAGTTVYALALSADGIGSGLFALDASDTSATDGDGIGQGAEITLTQVGDVITGSAGGTDYFTITINPSSGEITFTQINNVWHSDTANDDEASTLVADGTLIISQTVTDADGDSASATIELGSGVFSIEDDGPTVEVSASGAETSLDETSAGQDFALGPISTTSAASVLTLDTADYGTDGMGSIAYTLTASGASGLATADGDQAITLVQTDATTITGTFNGGTETAFTVEINSDGTITVTQNVALEHLVDGDDTNGEHNDELDLTGLISATATITDADGDTSSDSAQIGDQIVFLDDGPSIQFANNLNVDEDFVPGGNMDSPVGPGDAAGGTTDMDTASIDFGADGPGTIDVVVGLTGPSGAGNLPTTPVTSNGLPVEFDWDPITNTGVGTTDDNGTITDIYTLSINPTTGEYTFEILEQIDHVFTDADLMNDGPDTAYEDLFSIQFIATITDADGDTATDDFFVIIDDDTPVVTGTAAIAPVLVTDDTLIGNPDTDSGDFSGLFSATFGADGPAATDSVVYELSVSGPSGLVDTLTGETVVLSVNAAGTEIVGSISGNVEVFSITLDPDTGVITQEQLRAVEHDNTSDPVETGTEATVLGAVVTLTAIATDFDGDASTFDVNIGSSFTFEDDGPSVTAVADAAEGVALDESGDGAAAPAINTNGITIADDPDVAGSDAISTGSSADALVDISAISFGADGAASSDATTYALSVTDAVSGLTTTDGSAINLVDVNGDGSVIVGQVSGGAFNGQAAFAIEISDDTGIVTVEQYLSLNHPDANDSDDTITLDAGSLSVIVTVEDGDGDTASSAAINVGEQISFDDDGPSISIPNALNVDEDLLAGGNVDIVGVLGDTNDAAVDSDIATIDFGADGEGTNEIVVEIDIFGTAGGVSGAPAIAELTSNGLALEYDWDNTTNVFTATTDDGLGTITDVFTLSVDPVSGQYTFTLLAPLDHPLNNDLDPGNGVETTFEDLIGIFFDVTVTDGDGDSVVERITVNINDNSPTIDVVTANEGSTTLLTQDADTEAGTDTDVSVADFAGVFSIDSSSYGADGAGTTTDLAYALDLAVAEGTSSGMTSGGDDINLFNVSGVIYGSTTANIADAVTESVFSIAVDSDGQVTLSQFEAIDHADGGPNPDYDTQLETLANGLVNLTASATITDADGDAVTDSETVDLGGNISFADDGPTADPDSATQLTENANITIDVFDNDTAGADDVDLVNDVAVVGGTLSSTDPDGLIGVLTYNNDGTFTYDPADGEQGTVTFDYTITDGDGDTATATVTITLAADSTPTVSVTDLSVNEDGLADGTSSATDSETDTSGVMTITSGDAVSAVEVQDGTGAWIDVTAATVGTPIIVNGDDGILTVASDGAGNYTYSYTLTDNLLTHPDTIDGGDGDGNSDGADTVIGDMFDVRVTDSDGDISPVDTIDVTVLDDAPTIVDFTDITVPNTAATYSSTVEAFMDNNGIDFGADGVGGINISYTGDTLDGVTFASTNVAGGVEFTANDGTDDVFTFTVLENGEYTFDFITPDSETTTTIDLTALDAGNNAFAETTDGAIEFSTIAGDTVNSSNQGFGVNNQFTGTGEEFTMEFHDPGIPSNDEPFGVNPLFVNTTSFFVDQVNGGGNHVYEWTLTNSATGQTASGSITVTSADELTNIVIDPADATSFTGGSLLTEFDQLNFAGTSGGGQGVRLTQASFTQTLLPEDVQFAFDVEFTDGDGDSVTADIAISVDADAVAPSATSNAIQPKFSAPENMDDMSTLFVAANDMADDFGFDIGAVRGAMNSGFNGMAVLLGGMAMATEANAFENIFETLQPAFDASSFGGLTNDFSANTFDNVIEMAFDTVNGLYDLTSGSEAAFDASSISSSSPFTNEDLDTADLLGSSFEGVDVGFEAIETPDIGGTELAPQLFETEFGMPDIATNQFFLDTELDDLLAQMPELAADGTPAAQTIEAINVDTETDLTTAINLTAFHGVMPDGLLSDGMDQGQALTGLDDFHVLAVANSIAII